QTTAFLVDWIWRGDLAIPSYGLLRKRPLSWSIGYGEETSPSLDRFFSMNGEALYLNFSVTNIY
ncbi:hypothetical protein, partial [Dapis sp. BLCC M229]|uniref:hypothetical protein n=1 Tax=Dapis sp. BLCC M229 TaxID=3400188 RepID=UPI003CEDCE22